KSEVRSQRSETNEQRLGNNRSPLSSALCPLSSAFDLAYHFDAAGESGRALPYALASADQARARHSLEVSEQQYRIARRASGQADAETLFRIAEGLGDVLMLRGRYDEADREFEAALSLAEGGLARARLEGKLGELAFK